MTKRGYEIGAKGRVPAALLEELGAEAPVFVPTQTVLITGELDQDGLHHLIRRIADVGLELCEVRQLMPDTDPARPVDQAHVS